MFNCLLRKSLRSPFRGELVLSFYIFDINNVNLAFIDESEIIQDPE